MSEYTVFNKESFNRKTNFLILFAIAIAGLLIRLYFNPENPLTGDATNYFVYAVDTGIKGKLSDVYFLANSGWSIFLSGIFSIVKFDNPIVLMDVQRYFSISISVITIIPVYFLCRRFFNQFYSIIGVSLFVFEPHIIINSTLGITEPIFLFFGILALTLFLSNNKKIIYVSFAIAGLFTLIRYEGLLFFFILSVLFFIRYRNEKIQFLKYPIVLIIFTLILLPVAFLNLEEHDRDGFIGELIDTSKYSFNTFVEEKPDLGDAIYGEKNNANIENFLSIGIINSVWMMGLAIIPILVFSALLGLIMIVKNRSSLVVDFKILTIILTSTTMLLPAFYAYGRGLEDVRFLFMLYPLLILLSVYGISKLKIRKKDLMLVLLVCLVFLISFAFIDAKKIDYNYEEEVFLISKFISERTDVINSDSADIRYRTAAGIVAEWPNLPSASSDTHVERGLKLISPANHDSLIEFIHDSKDKGLTHLAVDGKENQPEFLYDIFVNDKEYPFLKKIFDSKELNMKYYVKIYKINYEVMNSKD
tara:strand:+ start:361 stop:1956 length:1596 start_codon:yes stop_codon:yes gene_type:complete